MAHSAFLNDLRRRAPNDCIRMVVGIKNTIADSFREDGARATRNEVTRRFDKCLSLVERMVMECDFSMSRALDTLSHALRVELEGGKWAPRNTNMWLGSGQVEVGAADDEPLLWTPERQRKGVVVL